MLERTRRSVARWLSWSTSAAAELLDLVLNETPYLLRYGAAGG